ncbi:hypothetical protein LRD18_04565 [Halorhodospira halochloris]|uniref:hypothetical protein n=1 Tax=Halorhodospira halochloris TaxID=1052 RepID=UPI001EE7BDAB|nr:hypothetical protein [Halorhodospira halochloris]MCG5530146.1 hypothetical protein [Halorhodospira halochloris]MCG5548004.1 hypothetical protein [Halorhodospira halochloris]
MLEQKTSITYEIIALAVAVVAATLAILGAAVFNSLAITALFGGLTGLALFIFVIPGFAVKLNPLFQLIPGGVMFGFGTTSMLLFQDYGTGKTVLGIVALLVAIATLLMPFVLIALGSRSFQLSRKERATHATSSNSSVNFE